MTIKKISNDRFFSDVEDIINSGNSVELKVKGTSMHPTLISGEHKVVLVPYRKQFLRVGSIALFKYGNKHILHRLISIDGNSLIFQGDNLPNLRESVKKEDIIAFVEFIIDPDGKIIDCKKQSFFIKNQFWRPISQWSSKLIKKMKRILNL